MNILEFQAKNFCREYGIPVPNTTLFSSVSAVQEKNLLLEFPVILKSQVYSKKRARSGGICLARSTAEALDLASKMFVQEINGQRVGKILAEEMVSFSSGYAIEMGYDPMDLAVFVEASQSLKSLEENGGQPDNDMHAIRLALDPVIGLIDANVVDIASTLEVDRKYWAAFRVIIKRMWELFNSLDVLQLTINPLVISSAGEFYALGVDMIFDPDAIFRHPQLCESADYGFEQGVRTTLKKLGSDYAAFDGKIGIISRSMDMCNSIKDILEADDHSISEMVAMAGNPSAESVRLNIQVLEDKAFTEALIIHSLGESTGNNTIVDGILSYLAQSQKPIPMAIRMNGIEWEKNNKESFSNNVTTLVSLSELPTWIATLDTGQE
jgi:succinyl-CoA synthetase beta subunit